ncbi:MAG: hypothetical protein ACK5IP_03270 [Paracoccus sp. (in: a-proteobacteria)]
MTVAAAVQSWFDWLDDNCRREALAHDLIDAVVRCDPADRIPFMESLIEGLRIGDPLPPYMGIQASAHDWASWACRAERKAYLWACWSRLPPKDQDAFRAFINQERAAA